MKASPSRAHLIVAAVAAVTLAVTGYMFGRSTATVNETLAAVVADLSRSSAGSTVVAAALLAGSCVLAAILIPVTVTIVAIYADRKEESHVPQHPCRTIHLGSRPATQRRLGPHESGRRRLPGPPGQQTGRRPDDRRGRRPGRAAPRPQVRNRGRRRRRRSRSGTNRRRGPGRKDSPSH